ncbi:lipase family protein [Pseudoalteromonas sp. MMG005]|uniref:lipase family protein n=1 Tax=Pseudoalteromonas sp. MMG005 TaxID=2822682 RepID=UPI001B3A462E|nr:lipase family protein [Pseudoalteromonas sp. MMG005]MBQ4847441.1 lipase family protein [Pseudoalteromonas sp. MMG005]
MKHGASKARVFRSIGISLWFLGVIYAVMSSLLVGIAMTGGALEGLSFDAIIRTLEGYLAHLSSLANSLFAHHFWQSALALIAAGYGLLSVYLGRVTTNTVTHDYFMHPNLLKLPWRRIGYSDRVSYIMAELSQLAYIRFSVIDNEVQGLTAQINAVFDSHFSVNPHAHNVKAPLESLVTQKEHALIVGETLLKSSLKKAGFTLEGTFDGTFHSAGDEHTMDFASQPLGLSHQLSAQGFVCKYTPAAGNIDNEKPYIVVVFRGSETRLEDWLTNIYATPLSQEQQQVSNAHQSVGNNFSVHSGFFCSFMSVKAQIINILEKSQGEPYDPLANDVTPVFFTGHSLGGALACIATRELAPDSNGACYTYGAPKAADYNYFNGLKTPIYRVVNCSDIVPRLPSNYVLSLFSLLPKAMRLLLEWKEGRNNSGPQITLRSIEEKLDVLSLYRHTGDLRYLTDIPAKSDGQQTELIPNPSLHDRMTWFFRHALVNVGMPIKFHSMQLYRKKLTAIARKRN